MQDDRRTIQVALAAFVALIASIWMFPNTLRGDLAQNFGIGAVAIAASVACAGVVRHASGRARLTWALFSSAWAAFGLVYMIAGSDALRTREASPTQLILVGSATNAVLIVAGVVVLYWAVRPERGAQGLIDAGSIVLAVSLGVWIWVVAPTVGVGIPIGEVGLAMAAIVPTLSFISFGALGWVVLRRGVRTAPWLTVILLALLLQTAAGLLVLITSLNALVPGGPVSALAYGASALCWLVAAQSRLSGLPADGFARRTPPPPWSRWLPFLIPVAMILLLVPNYPPALLLVLAAAGLAAVRGISGVKVNNTLIAERERLMVTDPLTGAFTRRHLTERLKGTILNGGDRSLPLSIIAMDLDNFKGVNDTLGHAAGDRLLCELVAGWLEALRLDDALCRLGGDEFIVVMTNTPLAGSIIVGEKLRAVGTTVCERLAPGLGAGVSCGLATLSKVGELGPDELMARADAALYRAKGNRPANPRAARSADPGPEFPVSTRGLEIVAVT